MRNRKVLAISSSMRNVGVCLPIASNYFAGTDVSIPILAFSGIMIPMNMVFAVVTRRMVRGKEEIAAKAIKSIGESEQGDFSRAKPAKCAKEKTGWREVDFPKAEAGSAVSLTAAMS